MAGPRKRPGDVPKQAFRRRAVLDPSQIQDRRTQPAKRQLDKAKRVGSGYIRYEDRTYAPRRDPNASQYEGPKGQHYGNPDVNQWIEPRPSTPKRSTPLRGPVPYFLKPKPPVR